MSSQLLLPTALQFVLFVSRLAQTLLHVPSLTWLVVEDSPRVSHRLENILARYPQIHIVTMAGKAKGLTIVI